jgi:hypothetical protein
VIVEETGLLGCCAILLGNFFSQTEETAFVLGL